MNAKIRTVSLAVSVLLSAAGAVALSSGAAQAASGGGCSGYAGVPGLSTTFNACISASGLDVIISSNIRNAGNCWGQTVLLGQNGGVVWASSIYDCTGGNHSWNTGINLGTYRTEACYYNGANSGEYGCLVSPTISNP